MLQRHAADAPTSSDSAMFVPNRAQRGHGTRIASAAAAVCVAAIIGVTALLGMHHRSSGHSAGGGVPSAAPVTPSSLPFVLPPGHALNSLPARVVPSSGLDQPHLDAIAARLDAAGTSRFPSSYSTVSLDEEHDRVLCYRTPSTAFDQYILAAFHGEPVVMVDALFTKAQMSRTANRILHDVSYWRTNGVHVGSFSSSPTGSGVGVTITEPISPAVANAFTTRYAPVAIQLTTGPDVQPKDGRGSGSGAARYSPGPSPSR